MFHGTSNYAVGATATYLRQTASALARRTLVVVAPSVLAVLLLGPGIARGQTITATSGQDYVNAINAANAQAPTTQIVINSPAGTVISLGGVSLPTLASGSTLQIGNASVDSPIGGGTITDNATLSFDPPSAASDTITTNITGSGMVTQAGSGTITLTSSNTYSGGTTISAGTLALGGPTFGAPPGGIGSGPITDNAALVFTEPSAITFVNGISGTGTLTQNGPGTVTLASASGFNTYSGGTTIMAGTLVVGTPTNNGTLGSGPIANNAALVFANSVATTIANTISGSGTVTQNGPGTLTFTDNGTNSYSGGTTIAGGTLVLGDGTTNVGTLGTGPVTNNSTLVFNESSAVTFANTISGTGSVTQSGPGTVTVTTTNSYSGGTTISGGTLVLGDGSANAGTLGSGSVSNNAALVFNEPGAITFGNTISGTGTVTQSGPGTVTVTDNGHNSYSGGTTIATGSTLTLGGGTSNTGTVGSGAVTDNGALVLNEASAVTFANNVSGTGTVTQQDVPIITLSGSNSYSGGTTIIGDNNVSISDQRNGYGDLEFATTSALPNYALSPIGTITLQTAGGLVTGYALDQTTLNAISSTSVGFVALGANSANNLDFTNLPQVSLGAEGLGVTQTFSGTLTPTAPGSASLSLVNYQYQVGGGNGFLAISSGLTNPAQGTAELDAVNNGFTILQGFNTFTGGMNVTLGVVELASTTSYCSLNSDCQGQQVAPPIQVSQTGVLAIGYALDQTTLNSIASSSNGTVALGNNSSNNLDFTNLPNVSLGAVGNFTYSGTITPGSNGYLLGGGGDFRVNSDLTVTQLLTGANPLTVNAPGFDPGTVTLVNAETYTGNTTINGGTLLLGNGITNGTIANSPLVTITNTPEATGNLGFSEATAITFANPITGTGQVEQFGPGTVTLTQTESYTGATAIDGGTLVLAAGSSIASSFNVAIESNASPVPAVLDISQGNNQTVQNLGSFWNGSSGSATSQVLLGSHTLTVDTSFNNIFDGVISGTGGLVSNGPKTFTLAAINTYSGGTTISGGTLELGGQAFGAPAASVGTLGSGPVTDNAALLLTEPSAVTLPNAIGGTGSVTQDGPGTVTLSGTNTYSGGTTIASGTTLGLGGQATGAPSATSGTLGSGGVADSGTLLLTEPSAVTLPNLISGGGSVVQDGPGTVTLTAINTYTGGTTITAGTLALGGATIGGVGSGAVTDNGTLAFTEPSAVAFGNVISGTGSVTQSGPGTVALSATNTYSGGTTIGSGAALMLGTSTIGTVGSGSVTDNGTLVFSEPSAVTFGNLVSGSGGIQQSGPGTVTLTSAETYTGGTLIFGGTLALGSGGSIAGSGAVTIANVNGSGGFGVLNISAAGNQTVNNLSSVWYASSGTTGASVVLGGNTLTVNTTVATVFDGVISGTGGLIKSNAATLTLAGTNTYSGGTTISGGTLALGGQATGAPAATVGTLGSGAVMDNANLAFTEPSAVTFGNVISGTGTVMQVGPGTITLSGTNTYSGGTGIASSSTLGLGAGTVGTIGSGAVTDNGTLLLTEPSAVTLANLISGSGTVTQDGPGTITVTAVNAYSGGTTISAGMLFLGGATVGGLGSGAVTDNATLTFTEPGAVTFGNVIGGSGGVMQSGPGMVVLSTTNSYTGGTTIGSGTTLVLGSSTVGTAGSGPVTDNGSLVFSEPSAVTIGNAIGGSGGIEQAGPGTVTLTSSNGYTGGTLIYSGTLAIGSGGSIGGSGAVTLASVNGSGGFGVLDISAGGNQTVNNLSSAWYNSPGTAGASVVLGGNTLTVNTTVATVFDGVISGTGGLTKANAATLTLAGTNTYSGGTTISAGTLALGGQATGAPAATVGTLGSGPVTDNANLAFTEPSAVTFSNVIGGTGTVTQSGPGTVTLNNNNSYSGGTTITTGTLALGGSAVGTLGSGAVTDNGTLAFTEPSAVTVANVISGSGGVTQTGPGTVTLSGTNTYTGGTTIGSGATLALGATTVGTVGSGPVADSGTLVFSEPSAVAFGNLISGSGGVDQNGPGKVTLTQAEAYTGSTIIEGGILALGSGASISSSTAVTVASTNGSGGFGVLDISAAGNQTVNNLSSTWFNAAGSAGALVVLGSNKLTADTTIATVFDGVISGTGGLTKTGSATLTLAGSNTYSGGTTISAGTVALGGQASGAPAVTVGTLGSGPVTDNAKLAFTEPSAVTFSNVISGTGTVTQDGPGTVTLNNTNSYSGGTTITAATLALGGSAVGTLGSGAVTDNGTLAFTQPSAVTVTNVISGTGGVTQSGPGTITLNSASTYTGLTEVISGTLVVGSSAGNGASVGGSVQVDAGATLAGYGSLGVATSGTMLTNNGTVIPGGASGNAPGTISTTGNYMQGSGGNLLIAVTPSQAAQLQVGGTATLAGTITFAYAPGTYVPTTYTVLTSNGVISTRFGTVVEQGSVPTALTRMVEYVPGKIMDDQVDLVLGLTPVIPPGSVVVPPSSVVLAPANDSIFSEQLSSLTALADSGAATLLDGGTSANDCPMGGVPPTPSESGAASLASTDIAALARAICGKGGWIHTDGTFLGVDGSAGYPNYHANTAGFLAGIDAPVGNGGLRLGIAAGYDHRWLSDSAGASATADVARFGVYAIQPVGRLVLNAAFLYGHDWDSTNRPTGIGIATAQYGGNEFSGGARASLPITLDAFAFVPMAGVRFASVGGGSFTETGSGASSGFGVSGAAATQLSVIPYARFVVSRDFVTASGIAFSPYAAIGYQYQAGDTEQSVLLTAADGTTFNAGSASLDRSAATLGVGVAAGHGNWSVYAAYGALVSGNWQEQEINVGLRVSF